MKTLLQRIRTPGKALRVFIFLLVISFLNIEFGCNYYRVRSMDRLNNELSATKLKEFQTMNKYIILSSKGNRLSLTNIEINTDAQIITADYSIVDHNHNLYYPDKASTSRFRTARNEKVVLHEVHILASNCTKVSNDKLTINLNDIKRLDVIERDTGKTIASYVFAAVGIYAGVLAIVVIIILLTKSSCPFIYVKEGKEFVFKGELYGGAIFKPLERDDYMFLSKLNQDERSLILKISNELKEQQFTDLAELILAETDENANVLIDSKGTIHSISDPELPLNAILNNTRDLTKEISSVDSSLCLFDDLNGKGYSNELLLTFNKPHNATNGKLIINARNSLWLDFAFGEFTKLFGVYYNKWIEKQRVANLDTLQNWIIKQNLPLSVYVKQQGSWKLVERIPTIGPLASRDLCIPIKLEEGNTQLEIKLQCGLLFWEVDYAAIDFTENKEINVRIIGPSNAVDENNKQCAEMLKSSDNNYLYQPSPGCETTVTFTLPPLNKSKSYHAFFHTQGYYEHVRDYDGLPDKELLESFKRDNEFVNFTKHLYDKIKEANNSKFAGT